MTCLSPRVSVWLCCLLILTPWLVSCGGNSARSSSALLCPQLFLAKPFAEKILLSHGAQRLRVDSLTARCKIKQDILFLEMKFVFSTRPILSKQKIFVPMFAIVSLDKKRLEARKDSRLVLSFNAKGIAQGRWNLTLPKEEIGGNSPEASTLYFGFIDGTTPAFPVHGQ